ncbi:hypothetical protein ACHRBH_18360, partial [Acinetobacter baumannii]|uniref:hypothetical protein n=1 Tax=Acinetobacter baumannii TaxID=470 RepID=UPI0037567DCE
IAILCFFSVWWYASSKGAVSCKGLLYKNNEFLINNELRRVNSQFNIRLKKQQLNFFMEKPFLYS